MRVATYARVFSESQEARGTIGSQLEALREKLSELGHEIAHEYKDDGYSGSRLDRPGLDAPRDAAELGLFEQVCTFRRIRTPVTTFSNTPGGGR